MRLASLAAARVGAEPPSRSPNVTVPLCALVPGTHQCAWCSALEGLRRALAVVLLRCACATLDLMSKTGALRVRAAIAPAASALCERLANQVPGPMQPHLRGVE
jgi:hypothetical protein